MPARQKALYNAVKEPDTRNYVPRIRIERILALLSELVSIPSHAETTGQEREIALRLHDFFRKTGIETELQEVRNGRMNVIARIRGTGAASTVGAERSERALLLTGHLDTVPPFGMPDPYRMRIEGNRIYGLGTVDMKGAIACMMAAMEALRESGIRLSGSLVFAGVIDEENRSEGTRRLLKENLGVNGAIVGEPTELAVCTGHRGLEWFEVSFKGKTVHGGFQDQGINAIEKAGRFMQRISSAYIPEISRRTHPLVGRSTMNYGYIAGGTQPSTVAGECVLRFDRRWIPGERYEDVVGEYRAVIADLEREDPSFRAELRVMEDSLMEPGMVHEGFITPSGDPIVSSLVKAWKDSVAAGTALPAGGSVGTDGPVIASFPGWTDAGLLSVYGKIPSVVFGPGSIVTAHSREEHVDMSQLTAAADIYLRTALDFCGMEEGA